MMLYIMRDSGASPDLGKYGELMQKICLFSIFFIIIYVIFFTI